MSIGNPAWWTSFSWGLMVNHFGGLLHSNSSADFFTIPTTGNKVSCQEGTLMSSFELGIGELVRPKLLLPRACSSSLSASVGMHVLGFNFTSRERWRNSPWFKPWPKQVWFGCGSKFQLMVSNMGWNNYSLLVGVA